MQWWLISDDDVETIRDVLLGNGHEGAVNAEVTCSEHGCAGCTREKKFRQDALNPDQTLSWDLIMGRVAHYIFCMGVLRVNLSKPGWAYDGANPMTPQECIRDTGNLTTQEFSKWLDDLIAIGAIDKDKNGAWGVGEKKFLEWQDTASKRADYQREYRATHQKEVPLRPKEKKG